MNLSTIVAGIASLVALATWYLSAYLPAPATWLMAHGALTGFTMATASHTRWAKHTVWLLGKKQDGTLYLWSWILWWAYHLGLRIKLFLKLLLIDEPLYTTILPGWHLGGWPHTASALPSDSPSVLDVTCELPRSHNQPYQCLPTWDTQAPRVEQIEQGVRWALKERALGHPVYIHCAHGHARSASLLCACLLKASLIESIDDGIKLMQSVRPRVHINRRQRRVLEEWNALRLKQQKLELASTAVKSVEIQANAGGTDHDQVGNGSSRVVHEKSM